MILVRPMPLLGRVQERWLVSSRQFFPQVHFAVQPLLRNTVLLENQRLTHTQSQLTREQRLSPPAQWRLTLSFLQAGYANALPPSGQAVSTARPVTVTVAQTPEHWHHHRHRTEERVLTIARQVVRQTQRVEERVPGSMALLTWQPQVTAHQATSPPMITEHMAAAQPATTSVPTHPWMPNAAPTPAVNLEQLTDQVMRQMDRRMTAWRERRGRI
jgi:hypothetical protein